MCWTVTPPCRRASDGAACDDTGRAGGSVARVIGTEADAEAILRIHGCGVPVVASAHAVSWEDAQHRAALEALLRAGAFQ